MDRADKPHAFLLFNLILTSGAYRYFIIKYENESIVYYFIELLTFSCKNNSSLPEVTQVPFKVSDSDKYGMMNVDGSILFEDEFDQLPSIAVNGIFTVKNKQEELEYFKADKKPKQITETSYIDGGYYTEGVIPVVKPERPISFIDKNGKELFVLGTFEGKRIQSVNAYFSDGLMMFVTEEGKCGYINSKGQVVIKPTFDVAFPFNEKVAIVGKIHLGMKI